MFQCFATRYIWSGIFTFSLTLFQFVAKRFETFQISDLVIFGSVSICLFLFFFFFFFFFFLIQFYVPFKLFHSYRDESIGRWGENRSTRGKTTWHTRKQNLACPTCDSCLVRGANPQRWDDRMIKSTEVSDLNHSATGAASICFRWFTI